MTDSSNVETLCRASQEQPLNLSDLKINYGCKSQVSLVLYALLKSGNIVNKRTGKPVTLVDFTRILRQNGVNLDVANLCNRVIVNSRYNKKVLHNFLKNLIYTVEVKVPLQSCK